jgi:short-subunit dehydrogenase
MRLQTLSDQVIVITGASSGIGLTTARMAARAGAKVVLTARDGETLRDEVERLRKAGWEATYLAGDVADESTLERVAQHAIQQFGRIDTWVNNAGVGVYGLAEEVSIADMRRLFDVNFWGTVHGCLAAIPRLRERGGALINVGSIESEIPVPYHSAYTASKHAIKGYTNTLRLELEKAGAPISVTLVKPAAIDTPFFDNAKNYLDKHPQPPPPAYSPEIVARTILHCAEKPVRDIVVGGAGRAMIGLTRNFPRTSDRVFEATMFSAQTNDEPLVDRAGSLHGASRYNGRERGLFDGYVRSHSYSTALALQPAQRVLGLALLGVAVVGAASVLRSDAARQSALRLSAGPRQRVASGSLQSRSHGGLPANVRVSPARQPDTHYAEYDERSLEMPPRN